MAGWLGARAKAAWRLVAHSLSGRLLLLTLFYAMVTQVLIFVPSVARYHRTLLDNHIEAAEVAILPLTEVEKEKFSPALRNMLVARAGALAVMVKRPERRELFLPDQLPSHIDVTIDLAKDNFLSESAHALDCLFYGGNRILHISAPTRIIKGAQAIDVIVNERAIHRSLVSFARRALWLAFGISVATAMLVFASLYMFLVRPMSRITAAMTAFSENPEDPGRIIAASSRRDEIGTAERELAAMQRDLYGSLQQKGRLAALGVAVAKIQHDLRNILASAQLASDRLSSVEDPVVQRLAPRIVTALGHAVALATNTLRYGRAEEKPPERRRTKLSPLIDEAGEAALAAQLADVHLVNAVDPELEIDADPEQLHRIVLNLVRNAAEALSLMDRAGEIRVTASRENETVRIDVTDNGPGIPAAVLTRLFQPFAGSARAGGSGLGLAIARDLARAHGGEVELVESGPSGTHFGVDIPDARIA
ncbi:MAG TPA: HAMP domain-containing sensor histidine kinase [Rhizomicrobium sp.]|nr:HAMP domain-containing sensor histidine kinase [Rhizomicrobium sp.]